MGLLVLSTLVVGFLMWSSIVWVLSWAFGFEFMWSYVIGVWLVTAVLESRFSKNRG